MDSPQQPTLLGAGTAPPKRQRPPSAIKSRKRSDVVATRLDVPVADQLWAMAHERGCSPAALVREAVETLLETHGQEAAAA